MQAERELEALVAHPARRYAVIDVGTNSVKFHIGEIRADNFPLSRARRQGHGPQSGLLRLLSTIGPEPLR